MSHHRPPPPRPRSEEGGQVGGGSRPLAHVCRAAPAFQRGGSAGPSPSISPNLAPPRRCPGRQAELCPRPCFSDPNPGVHPRKEEGSVRGARPEARGVSAEVARLRAPPRRVALELGACAEPRTVTGTVEGEGGHVSAGLFGKHGVNLAQNLGVWFWGPEPKFKNGGVVVKEFVRASKLRGRRKTLSKKCRRRMNS